MSKAKELIEKYENEKKKIIADYDEKIKIQKEKVINREKNNKDKNYRIIGKTFVDAIGLTAINDDVPFIKDFIKFYADQLEKLYAEAKEYTSKQNAESEETVSNTSASESN